MQTALRILRHYGLRGFVRAALPIAKYPTAPPPDPTHDNPTSGIDLGGVTFRARANSSDHAIVEETRNVYMPKIAGLSFDCAIDMGAHVGGFSIQLAKTRPSVRIIAIEPEPENYALLQENILANGVNVEAINAAASDDNGFAQLALSTTNNSGSHHLTCSRWRDSFRIRTIDSLELIRSCEGRILIKN